MCSVLNEHSNVAWLRGETDKVLKSIAIHTLLSDDGRLSISFVLTSYSHSSVGFMYGILIPERLD